MVRTSKRRGQRVLVIDFSYTKPDGTRGRYRRDAEVQTRSAALAEERRRLAAVAAKGSPFAIVDEAAAKVQADEAPPAPVGPTFAEVVEGYWKAFAPSHLKASTRYGYRIILDNHLLPRLANEPIASINAATMREIDVAVTKRGLGRGTRRSVQIVLRSVLCKYAVEAGLLASAPAMPKLPKKSEKIPAVISTDDAGRVIGAALQPEHRLALLLAFHAGLRSCEIRALRVCDVDLVAGALYVRQAVCRGVVDTPKSGHDREVPLTPQLHEALTAACQGKQRDDRVATTALGEPWGQYGLREMFGRVAKRVGVVNSTTHHLRHGFVTALLDRGVGAHIVKELAGHADLATTERYAHAVAKNKRAAIDLLAGTASKKNRPN
jgi:integrase